MNAVALLYIILIFVFVCLSIKVLKMSGSIHPESPVPAEFQSRSGLQPEVAIAVDNVTKTYRLYNNSFDRLKESLNPFGKKYHQDFFALKNVDFKIKKGKTVGIVGRNGSGKSTLLKIIAGVLTPTSGSVTVDGNISALLELGAGFNPELTGIENIYFNGTLMGYLREEIDAKVSDILSFADIGDFIYQPVKTYSSGMFVRLAFSVSINVDPDILIVDEALSVGDAYFQQKCMNRLRNFKDAGGAIVLVSHDLNAVKYLCDESILLDHGQILEDGSPELIINKYNYMLSKEESKDIICKQSVGKISSYGNFKTEITKVEIINGLGIKSKIFTAGEKVRVNVEVESHEQLHQLVVGMLIRDKFGQDIFGTNTYHLQKIISTDAGKTYQFSFEFILNIGVGKYTLTVAAVRDDTHVDECFTWCDDIVNFEVVSVKDYFFIGISKLDINVDIKEI